jgi:hypothetical protein
MENKQICQSCSMPIDSAEVAGTEKDGSPSQEYCKYCYQQGAFVNPDMTLEEMQTLVKTKMLEMKIAPDITAKAFNSLPYLKRWRNKALQP